MGGVVTDQWAKQTADPDGGRDGRHDPLRQGRRVRGDGADEECLIIREEDVLGILQ
jgi:hypothetical protein